MKSPQWMVLVTSLPGRQGARRMRLWRALKASGAGIVRDGVYVLPRSEPLEARLQRLAADIVEAGGSANLLGAPDVDDATAEQWIGLFDRSADYAQWTSEVSDCVAKFPSQGDAEARRVEGRLRRAFDAIVAIDFFPGAAGDAARVVLDELSAAINQRFSPDEPVGGPGTVRQRSADDFAGREWATRKGIWVDRIASAWLIRRFIDADARFLWLARPADCPEDAVGFDFDGAEFTHVDALVTFEVLLQSFGLGDDPALNKMAALVHYADVGGLPVDDAAGAITMLAGAKQAAADDDALLASASTLLDHLYAAYREPAR